MHAHGCGSDLQPWQQPSTPGDRLHAGPILLAMYLHCTHCFRSKDICKCQADTLSMHG